MSQRDAATPPSRRPPRSLTARVLGALVLILFGAAVGLALTEAALRMAGITFPVFDTYDPVRGMALRPGKQGWYRMEGAGYLHINSLGYRDDEHALDKPPGTYRIAILGDSFAESRQVDIEATFWRHLERDLEQCPALSGRRVEVLNFGIGGYATTEQLLTYRQDARRFAPDLVILAMFAGNDVHDNSRLLSERAGWRIRRPVHEFVDGEIRLRPIEGGAGWRRLFYEGVHRSRVLEAVNEIRRAWTVRMIRRTAGDQGDNFELGTAAEIYWPPRDEVWRDAWDITAALIRQLNAEISADQARFMLMAVTMAEQVFPDPAATARIAARLGIPDLFYPNRWFEELGQAAGFPVITLAREMQEIAVERQVFLHGFENTALGQGHWNETGHRVAADLLSASVCAGIADGAN